MLLPIEAGFNWVECFAAIEAGEWYLVVFRSRYCPDADEALLTQLDNAAAEDARITLGFHHYFIGTPNDWSRPLILLVGQSGVAKQGASHAAHRSAMEFGIQFYEYYTLERYSVQRSSGNISFLRL